MQAGREAMARHAWQEAFDLLSEADRAGGLEARDLVDLGDAAWWVGRVADAIAARERAYAAYVAQGERSHAALAALTLVRDHHNRREPSMAKAWMGRAERLLDGLPESRAHGWFLRMQARELFEAGDFEMALQLCERALDIGTRLADPDLQALGLHGKGEAIAAMGRVEEGRALQDEATVAAVSGELTPYVTGIIYCNVITSCANLGDYGRAGEWTEAAKRWCERQSITGFPGICRVHRAEIMRLKGSWAEAAEEAGRACIELGDHGLLAFAGDAFNEMGNIRLRMGELEAAADAFRQANELGHEPQPGFAQLRFAQGNLDQARAGLARALADVGEDRLRRVKLLPAQAMLAVEAGDLETARRAVDEIDSIAHDFDTVAFHAQAFTCRGSLQLAEGEPAAAVNSLKRARRLWAEIDLPYEAAEARALLGRAYRAEGDEDGAGMELEGALAAFERLGAGLQIGRTRALLDAGSEAKAAAGTRVVRTFMFTDIVKSTDLVAAIGDDAWTDVLRWHDETLRKLIAEHDGEEVDHTGDGFFVAFPDQASAVAAATAIQRRLVEHRRTAGFAPQVRIGLHATEATQVGDNYRGKGVHEAARVAALAGGGEIVATRVTAEGAGAAYSEVREVTLKGIANPVEIVTVEWR